MFKDFRYSKDTPQARRSFYYSFRHQQSDTDQISSKHRSHSTSHSDSTINFEFRYTPGTEVILSLVQIPVTVRIHSRHGSHSSAHTDLNFRYNPDTCQTRSPFCHSFKHLPSPEMLQTWMSFCRLFRFQIQIQYRYTPDTESILSLIQISYSDTVQIRSRHGSHSVTYSDLLFKYNLDTPQTRLPFYHLFLLFPQPRDAPDADAILSLIQISDSDTIQIHSRHGSHSVIHSDSSFD